MPQLFGSVFVFVHAPGAAPQTDSDAGHPHVPLHVPPDAHRVPALPEPATPQPAVAPQYCVLLFGSMHAPPQLISLLGQLMAQPLDVHTCPDPHHAPALPEPLPQPSVAPQCWLLVDGSMHPPLQLISLPGHDTEQEPPEQT